VAAASKYRAKCKKPQKPILMGDSKESPPPCATVQIREFQGTAGFCQIWIPNYSLLAKPIYEATKGEDENLWYGEKSKKPNKKGLLRIKRGLKNAPALGLPDTTKPFFLYVHKRLGAVGVLTQLLGSWHCTVAYLSKQLYAVSPSWPPCLCTHLGS
jgi:hypothetical protein